jgi:hypothetical protein
MSWIDYGQVPACEDGKVGKFFVIHKYISRRVEFQEFVTESKKWILAEFLNTRRPFSPGAKALVAIRKRTNRWGIICVKEAA